MNSVVETKSLISKIEFFVINLIFYIYTYVDLVGKFNTQLTYILVINLYAKNILTEKICFSVSEYLCAGY